MRQAGQEQYHLLGLPPALPAGHEPQSLFVLTERRFNHRPAVVGIREGRRLAVAQCSHQHRILIPAFLLGRADHPLPRRPAAAVGA